MRLLVLDQFSELGGAQMCLADVLREARGRGWEAEVMAPGHGPLLDFARECGFRALSLPVAGYATSRKAALDGIQFGFGMVRSARAVRQALRDHPADLIYVNGPRILPLAAGAGAPVLFHAHSILTSRVVRAIAAWCLRRSHASVVACSEFAAGPLRAVLGAERVRVIYNGVADHLRLRAPRRGPLRVGLVGRIAPEKGHLEFLQAARLLAGRSDVRFVIAGAALFSDRAYERAIRSLGANLGVEFLDWTPDVAELLSGLDILALPSAAWDASPRVVLEAFSAGVCVAAYPSGGLPELIRHGHTGALTAQRHPLELVRTIQRLADDGALRSRLAAGARREWEARFTVARFQREVCDRIEAEAAAPALAASAAHSKSEAPALGRDATHARR